MPIETRPLRIGASRPVTVIDAAADLAEALRVVRITGVRHLPVVSDGQCVGLLVDRDLIAAAVDGLAQPVRHLARHPVPVIGPDDPPHVVARAVLDGGLDAALVVADGTLVGIVTATDALAAIARQSPET
ncbi:MAG TPA: CBS domain-containing protein [Actinomycetospora sp.]|nr:CBS domain-containing protein [Actinomycetospora sp.]